LVEKKLVNKDGFLTESDDLELSIFTKLEVNLKQKDE
jgi:hypothetical protein